MRSKPSADKLIYQLLNNSYRRDYGSTELLLARTLRKFA
jgi:hypothetical protein